MNKQEKAVVKQVALSKKMLVLLICVFAAFTIVVASVTGVLCSKAKANPIYEVSIKSGTNLTPLSSDEQSIANVVDKVAASVVEIRTQSGAGSGVIISNENGLGIVLTNHHVAPRAQTIEVVLRDGQSLSGTFIAADVKTDLAVLSIQATDLTTAVFGTSASLRVGQTAIAIGNPLGVLGGTVTNGIISATGRPISIEGINMTLLQTNAAINPGNSGGGLFNLSGELIGIVNAKSSGLDIEGLAFAIPADTAKDVAVQLLNNGYVSGRAALGISAQYIAQKSDLIGTPLESVADQITYTGIYVTVADSNNLFHVGDRILQIGDTDVSSLTDSSILGGIVNNYKIGEQIQVSVLPLGKTSLREAETFTLTLVALDLT